MSAEERFHLLELLVLHVHTASLNLLADYTMGTTAVNQSHCQLPYCIYT